MKRWLILVWLIGLFAAAVASWAIWTFLPPVTSDQRFAISTIPLLLWALGFILAAAGSGRSPVNQRPGHAASARQAKDLLREAGLRSRRARHSMPLYLVAGPSGSGKSAIVSDMQQLFTTSGEVGTTSWNISRDAIFVESRVAAAEQPLPHVIDMLRSVRPRLPLSGVLLVISPADLALSDHIEQRSIVQAIARDLRELDETLGERVPIYLLLSKIDLVPGFREFFDRYESEDRLQPWGFTLAESETSPEQQLEDGFGNLVTAMRLRHVEWLSRESDPVRNGHLQSFPAQIAALSHTIAPLVSLLLGDGNRPAERHRLRGIFLTSAMQDALSIDILLPELSRRFAMPRMGTLPPDLGVDEDHRGFFIKGLMKGIVLPEAGLVTQGKGRRSAWLVLWAGFAAIATLGIWGGHRVFEAFDREVTIATRLAETASPSPSLAGTASIKDLPSVLAEFRRLQTMKAGLDDDAGDGLFAFLAGRSERRELADGIDAALDALRRNVLAPHIAALYEADLVDLNADVATLSGRLALVEAGGAPEMSRVRAWLVQIGSRIAEDDRELLLNEGETTIDLMGLPIGPQYIEAARRIIAYKESLS